MKPLTRRLTATVTGLLLVAGVNVAVRAPHAAASGNAPVSIDSLARDVERVESLREVKDVQRSYAHLAQFGRWADMAKLFSANGTLQWGSQVVSGHHAIKGWLAAEAGDMNGARPGALHTTVIDQPLVNLSPDGRTAKGRWSGIRFLGDGAGAARIDGGIYQNEYVLEKGEWKISLLRYYPLYEGDYATGFRTINRQPVPVVPYHFTPDVAGVPIPAATGPAPKTRFNAKELADRIGALNDEDSVRNLQHAYGYYVDRRMWSDVVDLFTNGAKVTIDGVGVFRNAAGVRQAMERMGPEGLTQGVLNDRPLFDTIVDVEDNGKKATARGIEVGMLNDSGGASWQFSVFTNHFVKQGGLWKLKEMHLTPLVTAPYGTGWGDGGTGPAASGKPPKFLDVAGRTPAPKPGKAAGGPKGPKEDLADLQRRLNRSVAFDGAENVSAAYSYYIDDSRWPEMAAVHAVDGHKLSPFAGWNVTRERILGSVVSTYGNTPPPTQKSFLVLHWRPQPVIDVSHDGRSASVRARLMHVNASTVNAGYINGAMYNDQFVLEDGIWRIWSLDIDEFYWQSPNWAQGWGGVAPRDPSLPDPPPSNLVNTYPPDVLHSALGERSRGFRGGSPGYIQWPDIVPMWFHYRNPVSGRVPPHFWYDCAPCEVRPDWSMTRYGYQLPPTGPQIDGLEVG
ncbi:nuclear transport factor 2 family protein [Micromonospora chalcea]